MKVGDVAPGDLGDFGVWQRERAAYIVRDARDSRIKEVKGQKRCT